MIEILFAYQKILLSLHQKQKQTTIKTKKSMKNYICMPCGWTYDPAVGDVDNGIAPGTAFDELPEDWTCPVCGAPKQLFEEEKLNR